ncbi:MAG: S1 RNA-binding domain-containing protein [Bacteroidetes bacterium]|nr:S1 RNA-binding domain-containing protein [Bacteroidota bacterium]
MTENQPLDNAAEETSTTDISSQTDESTNISATEEVATEVNSETPTETEVTESTPEETVAPVQEDVKVTFEVIIEEAPMAEIPAVEIQQEEVPVVILPTEAEVPTIEATPSAEVTPTVEEVPATEAMPTSEVAPSAEVPTAVAPTIEIPAVPVPLTEEELAAAAAHAEAERKRNEERAERERKRNEERALAQKALDEVFEELTEVKNANGTIEVEIADRIKGGLRAVYKNVRLFMPASHFSTKRVATEQELHEAVGKKYTVNIQELQTDDKGRKAIVVSRKKIAKEEFFNTLQEGAIVDGRVSFIATFGVFVDMDGVEGLVHISRLAHEHIDDASKVFKKGDPIQVKVLAVDKVRGKVTLSRKELVPSPWANIETEFPEGSRHKGAITRFSDFGSYVMVKPGVEGLLRNYDLSWGRRVNHASELFTIGQIIEVQVLSVSEEKRRMGLGYKQTLANPWDSILETYPVGTMIQATVREVIPQGIIVRVNDDLDGFVPRGRVRNNDESMNVGNTVELMVLDVVPATSSFILTPKYADDGGGYSNDRRSSNDNNYRNEDKPRNEGRPRNDDRRDNRNDRRDDRPRRDDRRDDRRNNDNRDRPQQQHEEEPKQDFAFFDLLSDEQKKNLGVK